jgi:hypothetical protein
VVRVTARNSPRLSLAALIAVKPGCRPRLIYRTHAARRRRNDRRKGFTETDYASSWTRRTSNSPAAGDRVGQPEHPHQRRDD